MATQKLFVNASQVVTCSGPPRARRNSELLNAEILKGAAVLVTDALITAVAPQEQLEREHPNAEPIDCANGVLTPGLVDSHTHGIFGKPRFEEQEKRAAGLAYMEIAKQGGGIHSSVKDLRTRTEDELFELALPRLKRLASYGTTTVELKSGYGLSLDDELKSLRVIKRLQLALPLRIVPTFLGAHEIPLEYRTAAKTRDGYIDLVVNEMLPKVAREKLAIFADIFCEPGVYTLAETRQILGAARLNGLALKMHADELEPSGAAELAAELEATSADHLAAISETGIKALAASETVATLLPGTMLFLGKSKQAPARALIDAGAAIALATDFNPGTSPTVNFPLMLTLAVSQLRLSVTEAVIAATVNGAAALGLAAETGQLSAGFSADLALFEIGDIRELPYWYGDQRCSASWLRGQACHR